MTTKKKPFLNYKDWIAIVGGSVLIYFFAFDTLTISNVVKNYSTERVGGSMTSVEQTQLSRDRVACMLAGYDKVNPMSASTKKFCDDRLTVWKESMKSKNKENLDYLTKRANEMQ